MTSTDMSDRTVIYPDNRARILLGLYVIALLIGAYFFLESLEGMKERLEGDFSNRQLAEEMKEIIF